MPEEDQSKEKISNNQRVIVGIAAIGSFIGCLNFFLYLFHIYEVDSVTSTIMSIVAALIVVWIILTLSGLLKEFTLKGGGLELSAKLKDEINNVRHDVAETRRDMIEKFADIKLSVSNIQSVNSQNKVEFNLNQTKGELSDTMDNSGITESKIEPDKNIPKEQMEKMDALMNRVRALEDSLDKPVKLTKGDIMKRANYYFYKRKYNKAKELYEKILADDPNNPSALFSLAYSLHELGRYDDAINYYKKILEIDPQRADVMNNIGVSYAPNDVTTAITWYKKALELRPNEVQTLTNMSKCLQQIDKYDEALEYSRKADEIDPNDISNLTSLASAYYRKREFEKAKEYATRAIQIPSKSKAEKNEQVVAFLIAGNYSHVLTLCDDMLLLNPNDSDQLYNKACALSQLNKKGDAIDLLQKAFKINPLLKNDLRTDPDFDKIRDDSRFKELVKD